MGPFFFEFFRVYEFRVLIFRVLKKERETFSLAETKIL